MIDARAYIGYGSRLFVVDLDSLQFAMYGLRGYFAKLYCAEDLASLDAGFSVLASSASELLAFDRRGGLVWKASGLGIDGVVVHDASGGLLRGVGEWDPPGGWKPFLLSQASGASISPARPKAH